MTKRFVVLTNARDNDQNNAFVELLRAEGFGWWHWLQGSWLLLTSKDHHSAKFIRDKHRETFGDEYCMILELPASGGTWSGFGPTGDKNMFDWVKRNWNVPPTKGK
jgi:hypothetical protein